jgi:DNA repair protein RecN (Recombination protein N)
MLRELHISNLAVITDARIELMPGLNCFTGATGAGKSLVIGALEVLLGLRSPNEMLRTGSDEGRVSGVFEITGEETLKKIAEITDTTTAADGGEILLTRKLYASGRSSVSLNGQPITLAMLKQVSEHLVDVHGQHDHQYLLKPGNQLDVLDQFGNLWDLRARYRTAFDELQSTRARLNELSTNAQLRLQQLDLYRFQANEIDAAELNPAEYLELQSRAAVLTNLEKLKKETSTVQSALYEADGAVLERLKMISAMLAELATIDTHLNPIAAAVREATINLEESAFDLNRYLDKLDLDPGELAEANERLNVIQRVLNKYGDPIEATLEHRREIGQKLAELERSDVDSTELKKQLIPLEKKVNELGQELSAKRKAVAKKLGPMIETSLAELGMEKAKFEVSISPTPGLRYAEDPDAQRDKKPGATDTLLAPDREVPRLAAVPKGRSSTLDRRPFGTAAKREVGHDDAADQSPTTSATATATGFDQVEFIAQTNPGQSPQPLRKIASGGELSRIMLALKGILAQSDRVSVLVFDEIDANVGGRLGSIIGNKLRSLAAHHQVLCITHLPQIASYADRHFTVAKQVTGGRTDSKVRIMQGDERLEELAAMIGGKQITNTTRAQAKELLQSAQAEFALPASGKSSKGRKAIKS